MPRPRRSKARPSSDPDDVSDQPSQDDAIGVVPRAMQNIEALKRARAQNHAELKQDYEAAVEMWKDQLQAHFAHEAAEMDKRHDGTIARLATAVEKKLACEEAIAEKIRALSADRAHLAMLIDAVYVGRRDLARSVLSSLGAASAATAATSTEERGIKSGVRDGRHAGFCIAGSGKRKRL